MSKQQSEFNDYQSQSLDFPKKISSQVSSNSDVTDAPLVSQYDESRYQRLTIYKSEGEIRLEVENIMEADSKAEVLELESFKAILKNNRDQKFLIVDDVNDVLIVDIVDDVNDVLIVKKGDPGYDPASLQPDITFRDLIDLIIDRIGNEEVLIDLGDPDHDPTVPSDPPDLPLPKTPKKRD